MKFTIITVCLNPGDALKYTLDSIKKQTYENYEVLIKDGGSTDHSLKNVPGDIRFKIVMGEDHGIYDAMNIAIKAATGDYLIFMNAGDKFYEDTTLEKVAAFIEKQGEKLRAEKGLGVEDVNFPEGIFYGNTASRMAQTIIQSPSVITPKICYLNIPCHQATIYSARLLKDRPYEIKYKIRADYEHFLYCYFEEKTSFYYIDETICEYEGGGFSESRKNRKRDKDEHREIVNKYVPFKVRLMCKIRLIVTLQALRAAMARSKTFGGFYEKMKRVAVK